MKIILACALTALATGTITAGGMSTRQHPRAHPVRILHRRIEPRPLLRRRDLRTAHARVPRAPGGTHGDRHPHRTGGDDLHAPPPLAEDIADSCPDMLPEKPDAPTATLRTMLLDCVRAIIKGHQGR